MPTAAGRVSPTPSKAIGVTDSSPDPTRCSLRPTAQPCWVQGTERRRAGHKDAVNRAFVNTLEEKDLLP